LRKNGYNSEPFADLRAETNMSRPNPDDLCPQPPRPVVSETQPLAPAIYPTSVWICADPEQADALLDGEQEGYVYQRDRHPNADALADKCRALHAADAAVVTSSGMAALSLALLAQTEPGDRILVSRIVYGRTLQLLDVEARRWGVAAELFDPLDARSCDQAFSRPAKLVVVETISNPMLRVPDLADLARRAHDSDGLLLVDNTFATPVLCRPLEFGADLVMESITKMMNGHSDVMLGLLAGTQRVWSRVPPLLVTWGFSSSPWDCWLALRGLATLPLRIRRASDNALQAARWLDSHPAVEHVHYPGLPQHPDHGRAAGQLDRGFGSIVTFALSGGREAARRFIQAVAPQIPFCPSLGEISTTLSHPASTSHRALTAAQRAALGVVDGTIRLSCGVESPEFIVQALAGGLA
jgi:cystathionine beta-lyase/cystathionine gamma-synthase